MRLEPEGSWGQKNQDRTNAKKRRRSCDAAPRFPAGLGGQCRYGYRLVGAVTPKNDVPKEWSAAGLPKLAFLCGEGPCTVSQVWTGEGYALTFRSPRGKNGE